MIEQIYARCLRILLCSLLVAAPYAVVQAQETLRAELDKTEMLIGEQATLRVEVEAESPGRQVELGPLPQTESLEWLNGPETDTTRKLVGNRIVWNFRITGFEPGDYFLPPVPVHFISGNRKHTLFTDSFPLRIRAVEVDTTQAFAPIKDIVPLEFSLWDYLPGIVTGIGLLVLIMVLIRYLKRRKHPRPDVPPRPETAHEWAERQLKALENKRLWQQGQAKAYYESLSMILKMYLESRFGMPVMEQTTDDLIGIAKKDKRLRMVRKEIRLVLQTADLVKFAKADPGEESHSRCLEAAFEVVRRTRFMPEEKGGAHE